MSHWKLILAYDGTPFHGWQIQPALPTVQGLLSGAIFRVIGERVLPQGSGRTDSGVHALGQVASFTLAAPIPAQNLQRALNRCLPPSIRVLSAQVVPPEFHARHSATRKTYEYRIFPLRQVIASSGSRIQPEVKICPPTLAPFVWPCPWPLDLGLLNQAAAAILGTHDFTSFSAADPDLAIRSPQPNVPATRRSPPSLSRTQLLEAEPAAPQALKNPIRTVFQSLWHAEGELLVYRVTATSFLHHMVRNLVGTFVQCGARRLPPHAIPEIVAACSRSAAGPTAPASGLFLLNVEYPAQHLAHPPEGEPAP